MSDLQCPAVVLLIARDFVTSPDCAAALAAKHVSAVFVARAIAGVPGVLAAATRLAEQAACPIHTLAEAVDGATLARAVDHLADLHRGESIAVVATEGAIRDALGFALAPAGHVTVAIDGTGWQRI